MYLVDTDVLSALRKRKRDANVVAWIGPISDHDLFLSAVTIGEVERGIERQRKGNPVFAAELARWLDLTLRTYGGRVLPLTVPIARRWGRLSAQIGNRGMDLAIAATALEHGLTVATSNISDFEPTGVKVLNPFASADRTRRR